MIAWGEQKRPPSFRPAGFAACISPTLCAAATRVIEQALFAAPHEVALVPIATQIDVGSHVGYRGPS
jgi:hypothetical protein